MEPAAKRTRGGDSPNADDVNGDTVGEEGDVVETGAAAEADEDEDEDDDGGAGGGEGRPSASASASTRPRT